MVNTIKDDWAATCAIYDVCEQTSTKFLPGGRSCGSLDVSISVRDTTFVRKASNGNMFDLDPRYSMQALSPKEAPVFNIRFDYTATDASPKSTQVSICRFPPIWPREVEKQWLNWINKKGSDILVESEISYAVCEFIEHQAFEFFSFVHTNEIYGFTIVVHLDVPLTTDDIDDSSAGLKIIDQLRLVNDKATQAPRLEQLSLTKYTTQFVISNWKEWETIECPICFCTIRLTDAVEITCRHLFCHECISTYAKTMVDDIKRFRDNPFKCPVPSCRENMKIIACVKKLLSKECMDVVRRWHYDLKHPPSYSLQICLRKICGQRAMRKKSIDSNLVFCDACGVTWCELCLQKCCDAHDICDPSIVWKLCHKYRNASEKIKIVCEGKWPWIKEYAAARLEDTVALQWVKENASKCPVCNTGIERIEGCFHMQCPNCATHFCYECGDELRPPYYGTHHCWLEQNIGE